MTHWAIRAKAENVDRALEIIRGNADRGQETDLIALYDIFQSAYKVNPSNVDKILSELEKSEKITVDYVLKIITLKVKK